AGDVHNFIDGTSSQCHGHRDKAEREKNWDPRRESFGFSSGFFRPITPSAEAAAIPPDQEGSFWYPIFHPQTPVTGLRTKRIHTHVKIILSNYWKNMGNRNIVAMDCLIMYKLINESKICIDEVLQAMVE